VNQTVKISWKWFSMDDRIANLRKIAYSTVMKVAKTEGLVPVTMNITKYLPNDHSVNVDFRAIPIEWKGHAKLVRGQFRRQRRDAGKGVVNLPILGSEFTVNP